MRQHQMNERKACGVVDTKFHAQRSKFEVLGKENCSVQNTFGIYFPSPKYCRFQTQCILTEQHKLMYCKYGYPHKPRLRSLLSPKKLNKRKLALLLSWFQWVLVLYGLTQHGHVGKISQAPPWKIGIVLLRLQHVGVTGRTHVVNKNKIEATSPLVFLTSTSSALLPTVHERQLRFTTTAGCFWLSTIIEFLFACMSLREDHINKGWRPQASTRPTQGL